MEDILLSIASPPDLDIDVFNAWVDGSEEDETTLMKIDQFKKYGNTTLGLEFPGNRMEDFDEAHFLRLEVIDQYRSYQILEHYLAYPYLLREQSLCMVTADKQRLLIERYWSLDDIFVREMLYKKLTKSRRDLEDVSEARKCYFVDLFVRRSNERAITMYSKMGYILYRTILGYYGGGARGNAEDACELRKALSRNATRSVSAARPGKTIRPHELAFN